MFGVQLSQREAGDDGTAEARNHSERQHCTGRRGHGHGNHRLTADRSAQLGSASFRRIHRRLPRGARAALGDIGNLLGERGDAVAQLRAVLFRRCPARNAPLS